MGTLGQLRIGLAGFLSAAFAALAPASAQTPLFSDESEIAFTIEAPLNTLIRSAVRSVDPHPATFTLTSGVGAPQSFPFELAARGRTRRTTICSFPPLSLDFDKDALGGSLLEGQNRLKLVTHCQPRATSEQLIVLEYTAYRLYNVITPQSFRVRAARVTYRDSEGRRDEDTRFGFLIEDADDVAARNNRDELDVPSLSAAQIDPLAGARYALFEFLIGNLDWSFQNPPHGDDECCHNSKLISVNEAAQNVIPLPYDFDNSGFVDAPYAIPPEGYGDNVRARRYRGLCMHNDQLPVVMDEFRARRAQLEGVISGEARLSEPNRRKALAYVASFFAVIDDPAAVARQITGGCRGGG